MSDLSAAACASSASEGRETDTSVGDDGLAVRASSDRVAATWSVSTRE